MQQLTIQPKLSNLNQDLKSVENRLSNDAFLDKAPKEVVDELKEKFKALSSDQTRIEEQLKLL